MPVIGFVPKVDPDFTEGQLQQQSMSAKADYHNILSNAI
jgi:hypothetical protein